MPFGLGSVGTRLKIKHGTFLTHTVYYIFSTRRRYCPFVPSVVILHLFNDFATDLLAVRSGLSTKANVGPKTALETPMSSVYHRC